MRNHKIKFLKVKIKSLAEESRIIRKEEKRSTGDLREQLYLHRIHDVREEARATHIAHGYLRGMALERIEHGTRPWTNERPWSRMQGMTAKYRGVDELPPVNDWRNGLVVQAA